MIRQQVRRLGAKDGQAILEFALVAPILVLFLYAIIQFGLLLYGFISVEQAARIGVRDASLNQKTSVIGQAIDNQISGVGLSASAATTQYSPPSPFSATTDRLVWDLYATPSASPSLTATVTVQVCYEYPVLIPVLGQQDIQIHQTLVMPQEGVPPGQQPPSYYASATQTSPLMWYGPGPTS